METSVRDSLVGRVIDGRYRVRSTIARGGMATVYQAVDLRLDRAVAVKVMLPSMAEDPDFVARFQREARSAARLSHPHVVSVFDQGRDGDLVYLVMEYVEGRTVRELLRERGPLAPGAALAILDPVLEALGAAHAAGIVHRDVKPENVLIGEDGRVTVADFGLARAFDSAPGDTTQGVIIGTVAYLSPEQVERGVADPRSDVYATGILLYELVTGEVPHDGDSPLAVAYQHVNADVPPPSRIRPLPPEIDALVARSTRRDPQERYADAGGFLADVRRAASGLPLNEPLARTTRVVDTAVGMPPVTDPRPARRSPTRRRRRRGPVIATLLLLVAVLAAGAAGWWLSTPRGVTVPDLGGASVSQARGALEGLGLAVDVQRQFSDAQPADRVIGTVPDPGAAVNAGATVTLVVSKGPEQFAVPSLDGLAPEQAATVLTRESLRPGDTIRRFDEEVPEGRVLGTDPASGTLLPPDSPVDLIVSKGPRPVPLPDVAGQSSDDAVAALDAAGMVPTLAEDYSDEVAKGSVISTTPEAGTRVRPGSGVTVLVSKGPRPVEVPALVDMQREDAIALLESLGLVPDVQEALFTPLNRVYSQTPPPGTLLPPGSTVTISIV